MEKESCNCKKVANEHASKEGCLDPSVASKRATDDSECIALSVHSARGQRVLAELDPKGETLTLHDLAAKIVDVLGPLNVEMNEKIALAQRLMDAHTGVPSTSPVFGCAAGDVFIFCGSCPRYCMQFCRCWPSGRYTFRNCCG